MSRPNPTASPRPYRMGRRAELIGSTRRKIVEATVELHGSVGPAATTIAGIAARAGVTRATVYSHFPDEDSLFAACSTHWLSQQQPPNPVMWAQFDDPEVRLRVGLCDLYRFYRAGEPMLSKINRDKAALPTNHRLGIDAREDSFRKVLLHPYGAKGTRAALLRAVLGHAVSFWTWRSLCIDQGLSDDVAVDLMARLIADLAQPDGDHPRQ